jgi:signal transduction histidine kinase
MRRWFTPPSAWSVGARITALFLPVALLLMVIVVSAAVAASRTSTEQDTLFNEVGALRTDSQQLQIALLNQETGIRGYASGGTATDRRPYDDGYASEQTLVADLDAHAGRYPDVQQDIVAVTVQSADWHRYVSQPVIDAVVRGDRAGALAVLDDSSRERFDAVRAAIATLAADTTTLRDRLVEEVQRSSREMVWSLIAAVWVVVVAGLVLALLLRRTVTRPIARLAAEVRQVASGDYNHTVERAGPPELAALGADVDEMRRRVVADLRVVQGASDEVERVNRQLERQTEDLRRSNEDLEQFAYVASHDLQEPLRKVASFCQLLQRRYAGQLDERADQYISFAVDGAHRMQRLINDLLAFSRIGRVTGGHGDVDLNAVVAAVADEHDDALRRAGGAIEIGSLPTVQGEEPLLAALIGNLVSNSVKFRRPDVPLRIAIDAHRDGDEWEFTCRDNGIGIDPEYADKVFVIFQRLHPRDSYPGTGIGLAVAKRIVEYHGGRIWIEKGSPDGATVHFTLPVGPHDRTAPASAPDETVALAG